VASHGAHTCASSGRFGHGIALRPRDAWRRADVRPGETLEFDGIHESSGHRRQQHHSAQRGDFLKQGGHQVTLAEDGFDALSKVGDSQPDLIFCDILMPRLDGYQTCAIIKRNEKFAATPW
jgi:hypothetical protein